MDNVEKLNNCIMRKSENNIEYLLAVFFLTEPELIQGISLFYGNSAHRKVAQNPAQNIHQSKVSRTYTREIILTLFSQNNTRCQSLLFQVDLNFVYFFQTTKLLLFQLFHNLSLVSLWHRCKDFYVMILFLP